MAVIRSTALTQVNTRHSKAYQASIEEKGDLYVVNFSYGAIGSIQKPGTKTPTPVDIQTATKIYDKLLREKTEVPCSCCGGLYSASGEAVGAPITPAPGAKPVSAKPTSGGWKGNAEAVVVVHPKFLPALLEPISAAQSGSYITNPTYGAQRKYDGHRHAISRKDGQTVAFNRLGQQIPVPTGITFQLLSIQPAFGDLVSYFLDGEFVGGEFVAFDLMEYSGPGFLSAAETKKPFRELPYVARWGYLVSLLKETGIKVAPLATTEAEKMAMIQSEVEHRGEGIVFRKLSAPYMPGRQGIDVKLKFWASATLRVAKKPKEDGHNSFAVEAYRKQPCVQLGDNGDPNPWCQPCHLPDAADDPHCAHCAEPMKWVNVGSVTLTKSATAPIGTYREIKYLYVGQGGRLYQPEDLGERNDVTDVDCGFAQLKKKQSADRLAAI